MGKAFVQKQSLKTHDLVCPICQSQMEFVFQNTVLGTHNITYYRCSECDLLKTEEPYWLNEAYSSAIASTDIGLLQRNIQMSSSLAPLLFLHSRDGKYLDYAGGYGTLCRLMRDIGFDFYTVDAYCKNQFAQDFVCVFEPDGKFSGVTAIEVLEHVYDPLDFFENIKQYISQSGVIIFSTVLYRGAVPDKNWWYYAVDTGQHISFYTEKTLEVLAGKLKMHFISDGNLHMFSCKPKNRFLFRMLSGRANFLATAFVKRRMASRLGDDYLLACNHVKSRNAHKL